MSSKQMNPVMDAFDQNEGKYLRRIGDTTYNVLAILRDIVIVISAFCLQHLFRVLLSRIGAYIPYDLEFFSGLMTLLLDACKFFPLAILVISKLGNRRLALIMMILFGLIYSSNGQPVRLLYSAMIVFLCSYDYNHPNKKQLTTEGVLSVIAESSILTLVLCVIIFYNHIAIIRTSIDLIVTAMLFLLITGVNVACFLLSFQRIFRRRVKQSNILDQNYRKNSMILRVMALLNITCVLMLLIFMGLIVRTAVSQLSERNDREQYLYETILVNRMSQDVELLDHAVNEDLCDYTQKIPEYLYGSDCQSPMKLYLFYVLDDIAIPRGYYEIEEFGDSEKSLEVGWKHLDSDTQLDTEYVLLEGSDRIGISLEITYEVEKEYIRLFKYSLCGIMETIFLINLIALSIIRKKLVKPINQLTTVAVQFACNHPDDIGRLKQKIDSLNIHSGDEIESLSVALSDTMSVMSDYVVEVKESAARIESMQHNVILTLADIIESRDENTGGHVKRTAIYVRIIANRLVEKSQYLDILTERYIENMVVAAPLHDMGKIHVPDVVLNKNGRLDDDEFKIMQTHAVFGKELLSHASEQLGSFDYLEIAMQMAQSHHEWWNGKGYPDGIAGEEIPLCARIMAVADVFDALVSKRCYKPGMPLEKACEIIREESGTHFDPVVAEAFLECIDIIKALNIIE